jgi:hypothetical protein
MKKLNSFRLTITVVNTVNGDPMTGAGFTGEFDDFTKTFTARKMKMRDISGIGDKMFGSKFNEAEKRSRNTFGDVPGFGHPATVKVISGDGLLEITGTIEKINEDKIAFVQKLDAVIESIETTETRKATARLVIDDTEFDVLQQVALTAGLAFVEPQQVDDAIEALNQSDFGLTIPGWIMKGISDASRTDGHIWGKPLDPAPATWKVAYSIGFHLRSGVKNIAFEIAENL